MNLVKMKSIEVDAKRWKAIERKASAAGASAPDYLRALIDRDLNAETFAEILKPFRDDVKARGLTPEDFDGIVRRARKATQPKSPKGRK